ncbi:PEP/pyruvate-binding domain-containing protein [uncultured Draconibacterium sp.]|uniref:PEP/pyruvate-binding domain-containing protein n=1 Tax=uncultured Draconibacterium sp. TaxID=1573823 RepID=UPI0032166029
MIKKILVALYLITCILFIASAKDVPIINYSVDAHGCAQIQVNSSSSNYYILHFRPKLNESVEWAVSIKKGEDGTTTLSEGLKAYPKEHYRVSQHLISEPDDIDGDGLNDMVELADLGKLAPFNSSSAIDILNGTVCIPNREVFEELSYKGEYVSIDIHLKDLEYVKFYILKTAPNKWQVYFMNTVTNRFHLRFAREVKLKNTRRGEVMRGEIVYHPMILSPNGRPGLYRFEFEPNDSYSFDEIEKANEILVRNMPFLKNNWVYYPMHSAAKHKYVAEKALYNNSRVTVLLPFDIEPQTDYLPLNKAEGYGLLKTINSNERPNARDIVIYNTLPNEMPRVGGIITTVPQTPLSHVNLRAIQDKVPNAYIGKATSNQKIKSLMGKYVYYSVNEKGYEIREASQAEVERHYNKLRPTETQYPIRNLSVKKIKSLKNIGFENSSGFGVKAANLATMLTFDFPEGTTPNGFAIPFYFYDEFMKYNNFYNDLEKMLADTSFANNYDVQEKMLAEFRDTIKNAPMPKWMMKALDKMHKSFAPGTSVRCRSSTNNEDLPGFSGAGLYTSKTQKPEEGHISKSVKQVYASLWNFRAFDERQFYRIDHFSVAMGVVCHPNYTNEKANGVAVSNDPIYRTQGTYYLNTQIGEDLVTNPEMLSVPEEILLNSDYNDNRGYSIVQTSNLNENGDKILSDKLLDELRKLLTTIQNNFRELYNASDSGDFAMEIEYKITSDDKLVIKQARPWVGDTMEVPE